MPERSTDWKVSYCKILIENNLYKLARYGFILFILLLSFQSVNSQENTADTIPQADSLKNIHSSRKATILAIVLPGLGQVYNKKYWKVPIIYATFGVIGYFIGYNNNYYKYYKGAYGYKLLEDGNKLNGAPSFATVYPELSYLPANSLEKGMNTYRRWRDLNGLGFIAFYALQVIDANVDAHFFNYDIGQDISMKIHPGLITNENLMGYAVGLKINLHF